MHFNQLTPAEAERLAMLAEEAGEVIQAVGKILRHGYFSKHPDRMGPHDPDNCKLLAEELEDFMSIYTTMIGAGDVRSFGDETAMRSRWISKKLRYSHHQAPAPEARHD